MFKNIVIEALKVQAYLEEAPTRTQTDAGQHFNVTRARISQLTSIVNNLPTDFVENMKSCNDPRMLKTFTGRTLFKISRLKTEKEQRSEIEHHLLGSKI